MVDSNSEADISRDAEEDESVKLTSGSVRRERLIVVAGISAAQPMDGRLLWI